MTVIVPRLLSPERLAHLERRAAAGYGSDADVADCLSHIAAQDAQRAADIRAAERRGIERAREAISAYCSELDMPGEIALCNSLIRALAPAAPSAGEG